MSMWWPQYVDDYSFHDASVKGAMVDFRKPQRRGKIQVNGMCGDQLDGLLGLQEKVTFFVDQITEEGTVKVEKNTYQLGIINPDYEEYLLATRSGIQAVVNWNIYGSKESGYFLTADKYPQLKALRSAKIISQEGNFLVIQQLEKIPSGETVWSSEKRIFVCWESMSEHALREIQASGQLAGVDYNSQFDPFNGKKCRPKLFKE